MAAYFKLTLLSAGCQLNGWFQADGLKTLIIHASTFGESMDHLWSPWRMNYISRTNKLDGCIFCDACACPDGEENLVVHRSELVFVILNRYPYTSAHIMVVPYAHQPSLVSLDAPTLSEMMLVINQGLRTIEKIYRPHGFNVGANIGTVAGAGVADHVHFHIVPRWGGDTNFMTTVGNTRVLPEELSQTFQRLKDSWLAE
jgi:ATP adenylyltransferase